MEHGYTALTFDNESGLWRCARCEAAITTFAQRRDTLPNPLNRPGAVRERVELTLAPCGHSFVWLV